MCEAFRSGLESVTKGQRESGLSIGLTESQLITNVILPQAFTVFVSGNSGKYNISFERNFSNRDFGFNGTDVPDTGLDRALL